MAENLPLTLLFRWIHIIAVIVVLGGSIFTRFILMPAAEGLPDAEHTAFKQRLMARWRKWVSIGIGLLLVSGFYNYLVVMRPKHEGHGIYHMLVGIKMILAFAVFFLASALTGRAAAFEGLRKNAKKWLALTITLAIIIVIISGYLKVADFSA